MYRGFENLRFTVIVAVLVVAGVGSTIAEFDIQEIVVNIGEYYVRES